jgi:hypothetical protein
MNPHIKRRNQQIILYFILEKFSLPKDLIRKTCRLIRLDFKQYLYTDTEGEFALRLTLRSMDYNLLSWSKYGNHVRTCEKCHGPIRLKSMKCFWFDHEQQYGGYTYFLIPLS